MPILTEDKPVPIKIVQYGPYLAVGFVLGMLVAGTLIYFYDRNKIMSNAIEVTGDDVVSNDNETNNTQSDSQPFSYQTITSKKLGVTFSLANLEWSSTDKSKPRYEVKTLEVDNKLYVYTDDGLSTPEGGQSLEVFDKDPQVSLLETIKKDFLTGVSPTECWVAEYSDQYNDNNAGNPALKWQRATILFKAPDDADWSYSNPNCPQKYTAYNGISFFFMDPTYPDRYYFLNIGQSVIYSTDDDNDNDYSDVIPWNYTLKIIARD